MRRKLYVMFVFCILISSATGLSILGEPQKITLPSRNTKPKKILTAAESDVMAKLISGGTSSLSESWIEEFRQSAANAITSTGNVMIITMGENGEALAGFKSNGIRNTGPIPWKNVTVTVKADISHFQMDTGGSVRSNFVMYKDGKRTDIGALKIISSEGSYSLTSPPFTIETSGDWHLLVKVHCYSRSSNDTTCVAGTIREINYNFGK